MIRPKRQQCQGRTCPLPTATPPPPEPSPKHTPGNARLERLCGTTWGALCLEWASYRFASDWSLSLSHPWHVGPGASSQLHSLKHFRHLECPKLNQEPGNHRDHTHTSPSIYGGKRTPQVTKQRGSDHASLPSSDIASASCQGVNRTVRELSTTAAVSHGG